MRGVEILAEEREIISQELAAGRSFRSIGRLLKRDHTVVSREVARNGGRSAYRVIPAQRRADEHRARPKPRLLEDNTVLHDAVTQRLAAHHAAAPDQPGLQFERLRMAMPGRPSAVALRAITESLLRHGAVEQDGPWLRLPTHRAVLSAHDERLWQRLRALIAGEKFRPPRTRELAQALAVPERT